jgi:uncharacterized protein YutE (UPF0331/DUF86 family)
MNERIDKLMYHAGLTAQGCWDEMDEYDRKAIEKFAELIVQECVDICNKVYFENYPDAEDFERSQEGDAIQNHFGVEE